MEMKMPAGPGPSQTEWAGIDPLNHHSFTTAQDRNLNAGSYFLGKSPDLGHVKPAQLKVCGRCHSVRYCSAVCQKAGWTSIPPDRMDSRFFVDVPWNMRMRLL